MRYENHRKPGSIGACATPGRVFKGMRMSGRIGHDTVTTQNVTVHAVDTERGLILLKGAVPAPRWARRPPLGRQEDPGGLSSGCRSAKTVKVDLPAEIFDVEVNVPLIHQVVVAQQAAAHPGHRIHQAARRGPRRWPQALQAEGHRPRRQGSTRAPQFAGGGVVHGPKPRDYDQRNLKKMKAAALRGTLSDRARNGRIHVSTRWSPVRRRRRRPRWPRSRASRPSPLPRGAGAQRHRHLAVAAQRPHVHIVAVDQLNTYDVLASDDVVFGQGAYDAFVNAKASDTAEEDSK